MGGGSRGVKQKKVPPDGGWGWFVVLGSSLINLFTRSVEPSFGLLFGDLLKDLGVATTEAAVITSALDGTVNFSGFLVGPMIKKYSYRKMAFLGACLSATAFIATSFARSMTHIVITYSIIGGLGFGLGQASTFVALNSFFVHRRGQAVGLAMAGTALGFMFMPQIISRLLMAYDFQSTMLILGGLSLNAMVGASLFRPVKWYLRPVKKPEVKVPLIDEKEELKSEQEKEEEKNLVAPALLSIPRNTSTASSLSQQGRQNNLTTSSMVGLNRQNSHTSCGAGVGVRRAIGILPRNSSTASFTGGRRRKTSTISAVSCIDLTGSTMHVHVLEETDSECEDESDNKKTNKTDIEKGILRSNNNIIQEESTKKSVKKKKGLWKKIVKLMDFDLLLDLRYLNILFGISITYVAEMNFKLVIPFFMANLGYSKSETALALSIMAMADILARVIMPPINDRLSFSRRHTLIAGLVCVSIARSILAEQETWSRLITVIVVHGFFRGFALINFPLVISEGLMPEKFAAGFGLSMVSKGIFIVLLGPLVGWVRDYTNSYSICLHFQSMMNMSCVVAWMIEFVFFPRKKPLPELDEAT